MGGWAAVKSLRRSGEKVLTDDRILGADDFAGRVLGEAQGKTRHSFSSLVRGKKVQELIEAACKQEEVSLRELRMGAGGERSPKSGRI